MILRKWMPLLLILGIIMMGACGCMNHQDYAEKILAKLESKYNKSFEIVKLSYEVDGENGNYYRAICRDKENDVKFVACYYLNGSDFLLSEGLDGAIASKTEEPMLMDEYCTALLNKQFADHLMSEGLNIEYAIADTITVAHALTIDDLSKGVEYCLSNNDFNIKASVYLFLDKNMDKSENEKVITDRMIELDIYRCNIDIVYVSAADINTVVNEYSRVLSSIEDKLEKDVRVVVYRRYAISREKGITLTEVVRGE